MRMLGRNTKAKRIIPHLSVGNLSFELTVPLAELVKAILHCLKQVVSGVNYKQKSSFVVLFCHEIQLIITIINGVHYVVGKSFH